MRRIILPLALCLIAIQAPAQDKPFLEDLPYYMENLEVFELNQEPGRAFHIPAHNVSLDGKWRFQYFESPYDVPKDFFNPSFNDRKWSWIDVPSNWEMQGFGQALFRNVSAPFAVTMPESLLERYRKILDDPNATEQQKRMARFRAGGGPVNPFAAQIPNVPMDFNPTGAYRTTFNLPSSWKGEQVFLRFEKVASGSFVWVNGKQVGYNEGAQEPSEYNITKYIKPGKNTVAVMVVKYCDGYYLEGQDYWRLAGILCKSDRNEERTLQYAYRLSYRGNYCYGNEDNGHSSYLRAHNFPRAYFHAALQELSRSCDFVGGYFDNLLYYGNYCGHCVRHSHRLVNSSLQSSAVPCVQHYCFLHKEKKGGIIILQFLKKEVLI